MILLCETEGSGALGAVMPSVLTALETRVAEAPPIMSDAPATPTDPLQAIADAMESAVGTARQGLGELANTASEMVPPVDSGLSRVGYQVGYGLAFGLVFPAVFIARAIPKDNAMVHGMIDGARAARDFVNEMKAQAPASAPEPATEGQS